jgi:hypothetical protein
MSGQVTKVNKTPYTVTITSKILKKLNISNSKMTKVNKRSSVEKILNVLLLRQKETLDHGG